MSAPLTYPLAIYRGDSARWAFALWADAAQTQPIDLTGVVVAAAIRQGTTLTALACTVTANQIDVVLTASASQALTVATSSWDLELTYPNGDVATIAAGTVHLRADVTGSTAA